MVNGKEERVKKKKRIIRNKEEAREGREKVRKKAREGRRP